MSEASAHSADLDVARGDALLDDGDDYTVPSEIAGVSDEKWTQFVKAMMTAPLSAVSASNTLGMFEMPARRLADFGLIHKLARTKHPKSRRTVWVAAFVPPLTDKKFLRSPQIQYAVFARSMRDYAASIESGEIDKPADMSLSGALAILHRAGPKGLETWATDERFPATVAAYDRTAGVF